MQTREFGRLGTISALTLGGGHLDLFLLHSQLRPADDSATAPDTVGWRAYREEVVPVFERLRTGAWGDLRGRPPGGGA